MKKFAVILAGGRGERFWPVSQPNFPKQFLSVFNKTPLIVQTLNRIKSYFKKNERVLIIPQSLKKLVYRYVGKEQIIIEPMRRNTAAAICLAAVTLKRRYGDGIIHVMPADHLIYPDKNFIAALKFSRRFAEDDYLVTYGIEPDRPETGYGYIKIGNKISSHNRLHAFQGLSFTEKPSLKKARRYLRSGDYLWNSGIFTFRINKILEEMEYFIPGVYNGINKFVKRKNKKYFRNIPDISVDYGVMEKTEKLCIIKGDFKWDDVGSWLALERYFKKDGNKNIFIGDAKGLEISDSIMYTCDSPLRVYGVKGLIIVVSPNGVLVCKKEKAPDLKKLLRI